MYAGTYIYASYLDLKEPCAWRCRRWETAIYTGGPVKRWTSSV